jgi:hypothetical protein
MGAYQLKLLSTEQARLKHIQPMENLSCHRDLFELVSSSLIRGIQMGEMSKLDWLTGLVKNAMWAIIV